PGSSTSTSTTSRASAASRSASTRGRARVRRTSAPTAPGPSPPPRREAVLHRRLPERAAPAERPERAGPRAPEAGAERGVLAEEAPADGAARAALPATERA